MPPTRHTGARGRTALVRTDHNSTETPSTGAEMKRSKAYREAADKIDVTKSYAPLEAVRLAKASAKALPLVLSLLTGR